jgi:integrase
MVPTSVFWVQLVGTITLLGTQKIMSDHLVLKGSTWHVRLAIPAEVQQQFGGRRVLSKSLGTGNRAEANARKYQYLAKWKGEIAQARLARSLPEGWQHDISDAMQTIDEGLIQARRRIVGEEVAFPEVGEITFSEEAMQNPAVSEFHSLLSEIRDGLGDSMEGRIFFQEVLAETFKEALEPLYHRRYEFTDEDQQEMREVIDNPDGYKLKSPITQKSLSAWEAHLIDQQTNPKTRSAHLSRLRKLSAYLQETGKPLDFDTMHEFIKTMSDSGKTRQQYLWSGRTFWTWANTYHAPFRSVYKDKPSPFEGHLVSKGSDRSEKYIPFSQTEVESLFQLSLAEGDADLADLIVFGAYTGARIGEIGNLTVDDLVYEESQVVAFKITAAKTRAGIREVPVHPKLAPLIIKLASDSEARNGYLFRSGKNKYGHRLDYMGKRFSALKKKNLYSDRHAFHSIRKTFITLMHQSDAPSDIVPYLVGHEHHSFTFKVYSAGPSFQQKMEAVLKIEYDFSPHY